jgi:hypothetical protein
MATPIGVEPRSSLFMAPLSRAWESVLAPEQGNHASNPPVQPGHPATRWCQFRPRCSQVADTTPGGRVTCSHGWARPRNSRRDHLNDGVSGARRVASPLMSVTTGATTSPRARWFAAPGTRGPRSRGAAIAGDWRSGRWAGGPSLGAFSLDVHGDGGEQADVVAVRG